jgi:hypothetical protein
MTPIKPVVYGRSYLRRESNLILEQVSHLDAFSGYLFLAWLPSRATGMTTGQLEASPSRSSRTRDSIPQIAYGCSR